MLFKSAENKCLFEVLKLLNSRNQTYGQLFKKTKFSHTTLQGVLKYLVEKKFIIKVNEGYKITEKGSNLFNMLEKLTYIL